jgi:hypothetical protein
VRELGGERLTPILHLAIADAKEQCQLSGVRLERRLVVGRQSRRGLDNKALSAVSSTWIPRASSANSNGRAVESKMFVTDAATA